MKNILIIEDDQRIALALCVRLKARGFATWIAGDSISGLSIAAQGNVDLIVLDLALPGGHGFTLARQLGEIPGARRVPIIVATASTDPDLLKKVREAGAAALIRKPYEPETLATLAEHVFGPVRLRAAADVAHQPALPLANGRVKKILIVEDDEKVARALALRMKAAGFEPLIASDGLAGVRAAVNSLPDAVILDISLPAGDGFAVAERIQTHVSAPMPIIFLTASKRAELRQRALDLGAVAFFEKPYEPEGLIAALRHATG